VIRVIRVGTDFKRVINCSKCDHWVHLRCSICKHDIENIENEVAIPGFVKDGIYAHITCVFVPENKYDFIASMIHDAYRKAMSEKLKGPIPANVKAWCDLDPQRKEDAIKNVKAMEEYFMRWYDGATRAEHYQERDDTCQ